MHLQTAKTVQQLRETIAPWRMNAETVALVPTMGALHTGHLSLVDLGKKICDRVVVSIFVNPTQFGPNEDFSKYPRTVNEDIALLAKTEADLVFIPETAELYPEGFNTTISVKDVSEGLCGAYRPGHFDGVATVVAKLLFMALPDLLILGEKDFQQLKVLERMIADLDLPMQVVGAPIIREDDGLALSSRNRYLSPEERRIAPVLYRTLVQTGQKLRGGGITPNKACEWATEELLKAGFTNVDYVELRDVLFLKPVEKITGPARLLAAAYLGTTRLIDNIEV